MEFIVIDTESCTGRADDGSLCSIGYAICDEKLNILQQEDILINPLPKRFMVGDKKNAKRTGVTFAYTVEEFRSAPRFNEVYEKVKQLFSNRIVLGFSMSNDVKYLNNACDCFSLPRIEYEFYDIQFIYQLLHPNDISVGLKTLNEKYSIEYLAHRSDEDAAGSVILLKKFLEISKISFDDVIKKYQVHCGKNLLKGYHMCYAEAMIDEKYGLKRSKKIQNVIFIEYLKNLPNTKNVKDKVCFSYKIEKLEVNFTRTIIDLAISKNIYYDHDTDICTYYVTNEKDDKRIGHLNEKQINKLKILTLNEFCELIGYVSDNHYEDKPFLKSYYEQLIV